MVSPSSLGSASEAPVARKPTAPVVRVAAAVAVVAGLPRRTLATVVGCLPRRRVPAAIVVAVGDSAAAATGGAAAGPRGEVADDAAEAGVQGRPLGSPVVVPGPDTKIPLI